VTDTARRPETEVDEGVSSGLHRKVAGLLRTQDGGRRSPLWLEAVVIVWLLWIYDAVNNLAPIRSGSANDNAGDILHFEKLVHLDPEAAMNHWLATNHELAILIANYYDNAHFAVTLVLVIYLWIKRSDLYRPLRNNLVLINLIGMAVFWAFPTAPPRLLNPSVYPDIVANTHAFGSWHTGTLATAANQLAAMPSLHIAWACWSALVAWRVLRQRGWALLVWLYPGLTGGAVLATGNHWLMDVIAGVVTFVIATIVADRWQGWWTAREAMRALQRSDTPASVTRP
jgi:membrane-associated phospholipid phosphatase